MAALLRQVARTIGGSVLQRINKAAVAEERRRLVPRRMHSTHEESEREILERMDEMLKRHRRQADAHRAREAETAGFDWVQFPLQLAEVANTVLGATALYIIGSSCDDLLWPFRKDPLEVKEGAQSADKKKQEQRMNCSQPN